MTAIEETGRFERIVTVTIPPDALAEGKRTAAARLSKDTRIKGFRPGKAPLKVVETMVGVETLRKEAIDDALPKVLFAVLREAELDPVISPRLVDIRDDGSGDIEVDVLVTLWPTLDEVPEYAGRTVEIEVPEVTDEDVAAQIERMRSQFAELDDVRREGFDGDFVMVDVTTSLDGERYGPGSATDMLYEIGSGAFLDGMDQALRGASAGSILSFDSVLPAGIGDDGGKPVTVRVLVKQVKARRLPELTDAWVAEVTEFETVAEMRIELRTQMSDIRRRSAWRHVEDRALADLVAAMTVELPGSLVEAEMDAIFHRFAHRLEEQGIPFDQYLAVTGQDQQGFIADLRDQATLNLKTRILLEGVADQEGISVEPQELEDTITALAAAARVNRAEYAAALAEGGRELALAGDILRRKAIDRILDLVEPVDASGATVELPPRVERPEEDRAEGLGEAQVDGSAGADEVVAAGPEEDDGRESAEVEE